MKIDALRKLIAGSAVATLCLILNPGCDDGTAGVPAGGISAKGVDRNDPPSSEAKDAKGAKPEDPTKVKTIKGKGDVGVGSEK